MIFDIKNDNDLKIALISLNDGDTLLIKNGIYKNKCKIIKNNITIIGENKNKTIIHNDDFSTKTHLDNKEYNTFRTYTMLLLGNNITLKNLTIKNSCLDSSKYSQAVSLHVLGDNILVENTNIIGAQDTLLCGPIPDDLTIRYKGFLCEDELAANKYSHQKYINCFISGDIDFIFGGGNSLFLNCIIHSIGNKTISYVCAPSHKENQDYGFTFINSDFTCDSTVLKNSTYLARPWRDYGYVCLINCNYSAHIKDEGFNKWDNTNRDKTARFYEFSTTYDLSKRVIFSKKLTKDELEYYNAKNIHKINDL